MKRNLKELKTAYLSTDDITETKFANECFGSLEAWNKFAEANHNIVSMWRKELELRLKQEAYSNIISVMRSDGKPSDVLSAAKFLLGKGVLTRDGEPHVSEEEVVEQVKQNRTRHDDDYLRLIVNKK